MEGSEMVPSLMFMTIGAVALVAIFLAVKFFSKKSNRDAGERAITGDSDSFERDAGGVDSLQRRNEATPGQRPVDAESRREAEPVARH